MQNLLKNSDTHQGIATLIKIKIIGEQNQMKFLTKIKIKDFSIKIKILNNMN